MRVINMSFGDALTLLKYNERVCRRGWNNMGWLALQVPDVHSKMTQPYIYLKMADNQLVPWVPSQTDILAMDWETLHA